jgi:hypothetical protein
VAGDDDSPHECAHDRGRGAGDQGGLAFVDVAIAGASLPDMERLAHLSGIRDVHPGHHHRLQEVGAIVYAEVPCTPREY